MKMKTQFSLAAVVAAGLLASGCSQQLAGQQIVDPKPVTPPKTIVKTIVDCSKCKQPVKPPRPSGNMHTHPAIPGCTDSIKHNHPHPQGGRHTHKYGCKKPPVIPPKPPVVPPKPPVVIPPKPPVVNPNTHTHPAIPKCTNSIRHTHPNGNRPHSHRYSCRKPVIEPPRPPIRPPVQSGHVHPAIPNCTDSIRHNHPNGNRPHSHRYSCKRPPIQPPIYPPIQPPVKPPVVPPIKPKGTYKGAIKIDSVMQQYQN